MNKQQFTKHLTRLVELKKEVEKVEGVMNSSILKDGFGGLLGIGWYEDLLVNILKDAMDDDFDNIIYWIYDLELGTKWKKGMITDKDGKDIKLKTINDLYKELIKE
jgi:hypothetical protein